MRELSDDAQSILNAARAAHDPTDRDRKRLRGALVAQLGAAALVSSSATLAAASGGTAMAGGLVGALKIAVSVAALTVAAVTVTWEATRPPRPVPVSTASQRYEVKTAPPSSLPALHQVALPVPQAGVEPRSIAPLHGAETPAKVFAKPAATAERANDTLAEQVNVLAATRNDLRQGRAKQAMQALDSNAALFEHGALREEFLGARVLALRALGLASDANAAAARFRQEMPDSELSSKVSRVIDAGVEP